MQIVILGNSGSGKSTLARQLAAKHACATLDLDTVAWEPGKIAVARDTKDAVADVRAFCEGREHWIVEGCYANLIAASLDYCPTLLFVDPGLTACLANCRSRPWEPHKYASQAEQDTKLEFLLGWVSEYYTRDEEPCLKAHGALFRAYSGPKQWLRERPAGDFELPIAGDRPARG